MGHATLKLTSQNKIRFKLSLAAQTSKRRPSPGLIFNRSFAISTLFIFTIPRFAVTPSIAVQSIHYCQRLAPRAIARSLFLGLRILRFVVAVRFSLRLELICRRDHWIRMFGGWPIEMVRTNGRFHLGSTGTPGLQDVPPILDVRVLRLFKQDRANASLSRTG